MNRLRSLEGDDTEWYGNIYPDIDMQFDSIELHCLKLAHFEQIMGDGDIAVTEIGMVLTPTKHNRNQYQRVGLYCGKYRPRQNEWGMFPAHIPYSVVEIV